MVKTHKTKTNEEENRTWKSIQSNDSEDTKSWEINGGTDK